jgi:ketosteroid isomerase-like protein
MSRENVSAFSRFIDAQNRRDVQSMLDELDAEVEWHSAIVGSLDREAAVFCGHIGVRELYRDLWEAFDELRVEYSEVRDLGDRIIAFGRWIARGEGSGADTAAFLATVVDFRNGKAIRVRTYLNRQQALEAAGLRD